MWINAAKASSRADMIVHIAQDAKACVKTPLLRNFCEKNANYKYAQNLDRGLPRKRPWPQEKKGPLARGDLRTWA